MGGYSSTLEPPPPRVFPPTYGGAYQQRSYAAMTPEQMQGALMAGLPPQAFLGVYSGLPPWQAPPTRVEHAVTVKNDVNLKKSSMRFLSSSSQPNKIFLEFLFDSASPCAVTVYYCVQAPQPIPPGMSLPAVLGGQRIAHSGLRTLFPKASGQKYSQAVNQRECLDTSQFTAAELTHDPSKAMDIPADTGLPPHLYPIVVVLEALSEADPDFATASGAPATGAVVAVNPSTTSAASASHVRVQLTYATILHKIGEDARHVAVEDGVPQGFQVSFDWQVKPLRQCVQVAGAVFELREIYGLDAASSEKGPVDAGTQAAEEVLASGSECVICLTEKRNTTVLPCRHMCMCYDCAQQLRLSTNKCPVCRTPVASLLKLTINPGTSPKA